MDVYEITGLETGVSDAGVNYLQPADSYQKMVNGFIYRQVLQSRQGMGYFAPRLAGNTRIFGIFEYELPNQTKQLLAFDQNFLYRFNTGTGIFDPIPFGGSMAAYTGFNIPSKDLYISATAYPTGANVGRFVFCGEGITANAAGSSIFFYDGTNVLDYTSVVDNPTYVAPALGALQKAVYVLWFNERINFIVPTIATIQYNQGVLYSGIRNVAGNGDSFNAPGSGLFQADTYQIITGVSILGQIILLNFNRMAYTLEKTRDAFNPYFGRAIPGVLGTNAKFSAVSWNDAVKSLGKTGILGADGRQNLRVDNKIPNFTVNDVDQVEFNLTYGGFDRVNEQFLWSYKQAGTNLATQDAILVSNYEENTWSIFDQRVSVFGGTDIGVNLTWDDIEAASGDPSWAQWETTEDIWDRIGLGSEVEKTLAGDDLGFIWDYNKDFDDYFTTISAVVTGATTTLTVAATGVLAGDLVTISNVQGMLDDEGRSGINNFDEETNEYDGQPYTVISASPTSIVINLDSTLLTAYVPNTGTISKIISFYAETIPFNPYRSIGRRCYVSHVEFYIATNGGRLLVDVTAEQQAQPFKQNVLITATDTTEPFQWVSMSVNQEANFLTFILKQQSPSVQLILTNLRIHCAPGGLTSN